MPKSKQQKRTEAIERMKNYKWRDSRAKREDKLTRDEWETRLREEINRG